MLHQALLICGKPVDRSQTSRQWLKRPKEQRSKLGVIVLVYCLLASLNLQ